MVEQLELDFMGISDEFSRNPTKSMHKSHC